MFIDYIFNGYNGYILLRNLIILLIVLSITLNIIFYFKQNKIITYSIIVIAPLNSFIVSLWIINHSRQLLNEFYELAIPFRENSNEALIDGIIFYYKLLNQELVLSVVSFIVLIISITLLKKKSAMRINNSK